jgi:hypothetical protein
MPVLAANEPGRLLAPQATKGLLAPVVVRTLLARGSTGRVLATARVGAVLARGPIPAQQEVYIGASLPVGVPYPAVGFEEAAGYPGLYTEKVNVP